MFFQMSLPCYQIFLQLIDILPQSFFICCRYERVDKEKAAFDGLELFTIVIQRIVDVTLEIFYFQQMGLILHARAMPYR